MFPAKDMTLDAAEVGVTLEEGDGACTWESIPCYLCRGIGGV